MTTSVQSALHLFLGRSAADRAHAELREQSAQGVCGGLPVTSASPLRKLTPKSCTTSSL
ncbi:hypothetical protein [Lentzea jiangxiensis]|uniref:hypothetical protein n=1 Tax=Lentzea jiangxiensis TaxID=641025 RepID=UPI0015A11D9B|nr:hypothetical protein [Lentzea jiangxiensis]